MIYPQIYQTGYGRFRPNKSDDHLSCRYYRGGWHRSFPALIPRTIKIQEKATHWAVTWSSLITVSCSVKFSRLLHPVGSGFVSQNPSPGYCSHNPYASMARRSITPLRPDTPQTHPTPPELSTTHRSRRSGLWGIILSFPRLSPV